MEKSTIPCFTTWMSSSLFDLVLERMRDIRTSERMLYQKVTDIYATADDYIKLT
ncbi:hypothetical protein AGMMS50239_22720 [Bacteroidia bacterium]|nr:hypothetical protein AGMMS50239_22720 [Bacteroidia bacterium]